MSIATELQPKLEQNQNIVFITEADELLAAWQFKRKSSTKRSKNLAMVPTEWRFSAPPRETDALMPCHVSIGSRAGMMYSQVTPAPEFSTQSCHHTFGSDASFMVPDMDALDAVSFARRNVAPYVSPIMDTVTLARVCKDLGIGGKAITKVINGRQYIAFAGYAGLRTIFTGTRYSINNRMIINMAIGTLGLKKMVKSGGIITICIAVPLTVLEAFLSDHASCYELVGNIASDLIKIGVPMLMAEIAGLAVGAFTTIAFLPIAIVIGVGFFTSVVLNKMDDKYQLTEKLIIALEQFGMGISDGYVQVQQAAERIPHTLQKGIIWRTLGVDIDRGLP